MQQQPFVAPGVDGLLEVAWHAGATDLLLTVDRPPQMRLHGNLIAIPGTPRLKAADTDDLLGELLTETQIAKLDERREYDFSVSWRNLARVRATLSSSGASRRCPCASSQ